MDESDEEKEKRGEKRDFAAHAGEPEVPPAKKARLDAPEPGTDVHTLGTPTGGALQGDAMDIDEPPLLDSELRRIDVAIELVNTEIMKVEKLIEENIDEVKKLESRLSEINSMAPKDKNKLKGESSTLDRKVLASTHEREQLRKDKEQLRKDKEQLRKKEEQLREEKLERLRRHAPLILGTVSAPAAADGS
jgi:chromosome segregation ATPase